MKHTEQTLASIPVSKRENAKRRVVWGIFISAVGSAVVAADFALLWRSNGQIDVLNLALILVGLGIVMLGGVVAKGELIVSAILDLLGPIGDFIAKVMGRN